MSIVETRATASHKYYMNKKKEDILRRLHDLHKLVYKADPHPSLVWRWRGMKKADLSSAAMNYHRSLPSE